MGLLASWFALLFPAGIAGADGGPALALADVASGSYSMWLMTGVTVLLLPLVAGLQAWSYWLFRHRITPRRRRRSAAEPGRPRRAPGRRGRRRPRGRRSERRTRDPARPRLPPPEIAMTHDAAGAPTPERFTGGC